MASRAMSPFLRISYAESNRVLPRPYQKALVALCVAAFVVVPPFISNFHVHLLNLSLIAVIAALGLNLLTGYCGQVSLGHAAFLAIGAYTTVVVGLQWGAPFWLAVPAAGAAGGVFGFLIGLPSLRFRGIYLAISTLAMHYAVSFGVTTYQANVGAAASAGFSMPDPALGPFVLSDDRAWYYFLLALAAAATVFCANLVRTRAGRAWMAIRDRDIAAEALGVDIARYKLLAFVVSSALAAAAGSLAAYYTNVVTAEQFSLDLAIAYLAMIIVGGMGSVLGSIFGAMFITFLPFAIDALFEFAPRSWQYGSQIFGVQYGAIGVCIIVFLIFEPKGLVEIWRRGETYFERWPFRYRPLESSRR